MDDVLNDTYDNVGSNIETFEQRGSEWVITGG